MSDNYGRATASEVSEELKDICYPKTPIRKTNYFVKPPKKLCSRNCHRKAEFVCVKCKRLLCGWSRCSEWEEVFNPEGESIGEAYICAFNCKDL